MRKRSQFEDYVKDSLKNNNQELLRYSKSSDRLRSVGSRSSLPKAQQSTGDLLKNGGDAYIPSQK